MSIKVQAVPVNYPSQSGKGAETPVFITKRGDGGHLADDVCCTQYIPVTGAEWAESAATESESFQALGALRVVGAVESHIDGLGTCFAPALSFAGVAHELLDPVGLPVQGTEDAFDILGPRVARPSCPLAQRLVSDARLLGKITEAERTLFECFLYGHNDLLSSHNCLPGGKYNVHRNPLQSIRAGSRFVNNENTTRSSI